MRISMPKVKSLHSREDPASCRGVWSCASEFCYCVWCTFILRCTQARVFWLSRFLHTDTCMTLPRGTTGTTEWPAIPGGKRWSVLLDNVENLRDRFIKAKKRTRTKSGNLGGNKAVPLILLEQECLSQFIKHWETGNNADVEVNDNNYSTHLQCWWQYVCLLWLPGSLFSFTLSIVVHFVYIHSTFVFFLIVRK